MFNVQQLATSLIAKNPRIANNPQAQEYLRLIQSGDNSRMKEVVTNVAQTYGMTQEQMAEDALRFFGLRR